MASSALVWIFIGWLVAASALEVYKEPSEVFFDEYQDSSYIDPGPLVPRDRGLWQSLLLYKMMRNLQHEDPAQFSKPISSDPEKLLWDGKDPSSKRYVPVASEVKVTGKPYSIRPQRKWKIKKGAHMVCYFKLCSFRPTL